MLDGQSSTQSEAPTGHHELVGKRCFVITPYDTKSDETGRIVDFENVFSMLIEPVTKELELNCKRSRDTTSPGLIHKNMIEQILDWDLALVDITTANPNVFYELGIRHTARAKGTIILRQEGTKNPFNIQGMRSLTYSLEPNKIEESRRALRDTIRTVVAHPSEDSLVHQIVPGLNVSRRARVIHEREVHHWLLDVPRSLMRPNGKGVGRPRTKRLGVISGDLIYVENIDVWVNPENTRMEMARIHDDSVSATIRYYGGRRSVRGDLQCDIIGKKLSRKVHSCGVVEATTVIVTDPGRLKRPNKVRRIFHLAAQHGEPCNGYVTVRSVEDCVKNALETLDTLNNAWPVHIGLMKPLTSIIFPLFGTRGADRNPQATANAIVESAATYLKTWSESRIDRVYFLAYTDRDLDLCNSAFQALGLPQERRPPSATDTQDDAPRQSATHMDAPHT